MSVNQIEFYKVRAVDEFDRVFYAQYAIPFSVSLTFPPLSWVMEKLVKDILVLMGTAASAKWEGEIWIYEPEPV